MSDQRRASRPRVLVTAGPTQEPIDAVRYLSNRSSGRMGLALAGAAAGRGWPTTLLLGPGPLSPPDGSHLTTRRFRTTAELQALLDSLWPEHDVLVMAAAVADYRPRGGAGAGKIRRRGEGLVLELEATPDLLAEAAAVRRSGQLVIGFALEPADGLEAAAREKLRRKGVDAIVANPLETMDAESVSGRLILADGRVLVPAGSLAKERFAAWLLDRVAELLAG
ncbi:MAG: phosphopantothenoylcysteine decarboxylase domain-containing protein [Planctomycetota bacterium]